MARPRRQPPPRGIEPFGQRLRRLRLAKGLTQTELGHLVGLSNRMVAYYEIQGGEPRPELVKKLCSALTTTAAVLLGQEEADDSQNVERPKSVRLWRRFKRLEDLPLHDRKAILKMIDAMTERASRRKAS